MSQVTQAKECLERVHQLVGAGLDTTNDEERLKAALLARDYLSRGIAHSRNALKADDSTKELPGQLPLPGAPPRPAVLEPPPPPSMPVTVSGDGVVQTPADVAPPTAGPTSTPAPTSEAEAHKLTDESLPVLAYLRARAGSINDVVMHAELVAHTGLDKDAINRSTALLRRRGLIDSVGRGRFKAIESEALKSLAAAANITGDPARPEDHTYPTPSPDAPPPPTPPAEATSEQRPAPPAIVPPQLGERRRFGNNDVMWNADLQKWERVPEASNGAEPEPTPQPEPEPQPTPEPEAEQHVHEWPEKPEMGEDRVQRIRCLHCDHAMRWENGGWIDDVEGTAGKERCTDCGNMKPYVYPEDGRCVECRRTAIAQAAEEVGAT